MTSDNDTAITLPERGGGGFKRTWDGAFADDQDADLAAELSTISVKSLHYLHAKIAKGDGSTEQMLAMIIGHIKSGDQGKKNLEPRPSTSKQIPQIEQAGGSKDDDVITLDEVDEDNNSGEQSETPLNFFNIFETLQSLFPDLSPAFLQVNIMFITNDHTLKYFIFRTKLGKLA